MGRCEIARHDDGHRTPTPRYASVRSFAIRICRYPGERGLSRWGLRFGFAPLCWAPVGRSKSSRPFRNPFFEGANDHGRPAIRCIRQVRGASHQPSPVIDRDTRAWRRRGSGRGRRRLDRGGATRILWSGLSTADTPQDVQRDRHIMFELGGVLQRLLRFGWRRSRCLRR